MSLFGSLSAGVSGLTAQGQAMSVISDNLANTTTIGYKTNQYLFSQLVTSSGLSGTLYNAGGVSASTQREQTVQGSLQSTDSSTDLALSGNGFFVTVNTPTVSDQTSYFYTRDGSFSEDKQGLLEHSSGTYLLGWPTDSEGDIANLQDLQPVQLQTVGSSARATSSLSIGLNLNASESDYNMDETLTPAATVPTDNTQGRIIANLQQVVADPTKAQYLTDVTMYDSQGGSHDVSLAFIKTGDNQWQYAAYTDGSDIINQTPGQNTMIGYGTLEFNGDGSLKNVTVRNTQGALQSSGSLPVDWSGGVPQGNVTFNFGSYTGGYSIGQDQLESAGLGVENGVQAVAVDQTKAAAAGATLPASDVQFTIDNTSGTPMMDATIGGVAATPVAIPSPLTGATTLEFDNGLSMTITPDLTASIPAAGSTATLGTGTMSATLVNPLNTGVGTDGVIQQASSYNSLFNNQDGFGAGTLGSVSVDANGYVIGSFTNGETKKLYKLVIAEFQNPSALDPINGNLFTQTDESGKPLYKQAGVGNTATVKDGALEQSTVDIAGQFSNMIVTQRAFQASSKTISTVDQMLNDLLQIQ